MQMKIRIQRSYLIEFISDKCFILFFKVVKQIRKKFPLYILNNLLVSVEINFKK